MSRTDPPKIIDLTERLRRTRRRELVCALLALWAQYFSLGTLLLYGLLRYAVCRSAPLGTYCGPLVLLWPLSYALLLASWCADRRRPDRDPGERDDF